jgi:predicted transcriptional regulator
LPQARLSRILKAMEVHFTPEQEAQLTQMATKAGTNPERLVEDVLVRYLDDEARFLVAVEKGIAAAERGEFIEEEQMDARMERMFKP